MHKSSVKIYFLILLSILSGGAFAQEKPLAESSFEDIIARYTFIGDFSQKPETREISDELFWKYPFIIPPISFEIKAEVDDIAKEFPASTGDGRDVEHLNHARVLFINGEYESAKKVLLKARSLYGASSKYMRRTEYLIGLTFLQIAREKYIAFNKDFENIVVKKEFSSAAAFLSLALIKKNEIDDPMFMEVTAKGLYNLSAIYYTYKQWAGAYGAADEGLNFLRKYGRKEFRSLFRRMIAESWIKNRSYFRAVQELDTVIRQDVSKEGASAAFARVGDIYFDLNNYDLAEDAYALNNAIDRDRQYIGPTQLILRGESLFWLGKFSEAQQMLHYGISSINQVNAAKAPDDFASWAKLRIADAYLGRRSQLKNVNSSEGDQLLEQATLDYFRVEKDYPKSEAAKIAKIRRACLELPFYKGKNVNHARVLLEEMKNTPLVNQAKELSWSCQVGSYAQRDRTDDMLNRVKEFLMQYPHSRFLQSLVDPVIETQSEKFFTYIKEGKSFLAVKFFEVNRKNLFKKMTDEVSIELFKIYVDMFDISSAKEFWPTFQKQKRDQNNLIRSIVFVNEMHDANKSENWIRLSKNFGREMESLALNQKKNSESQTWVKRILQSSLAPIHYPWLINVIESWSTDKVVERCENLYPLYSKIISSKDKKIIDRIKPKIEIAISKEFPQIFASDERCGEMIIQMEQDMYETNLEVLKSKWLARFSWPLNQIVASYYWLLSEKIAKTDRKSAELIWKHLEKNASKDSPEWKFAKVRLDKNKTEFEGLWE